MRRRIRVATAAALAAFTVAAAGCWQGPGVDRVRWAVERQLPGTRFDPEVHVRFGRLTTGFVRWVVDLALDDADDDERRARAIVNAIHRVEVAVWTNRGAAEPAALDAVAMPRSLERMLAQEGWAVMLESRTGGERAWVLTRQDAGAIHALYLVALDASGLSVVRLEGRFDEAFVRALSARPREAADRILEGRYLRGSPVRQSCTLRPWEMGRVRLGAPIAGGRGVRPVRQAAPYALRA